MADPSKIQVNTQSSLNQSTSQTGANLAQSQKVGAATQLYPSTQQQQQQQLPFKDSQITEQRFRSSELKDNSLNVKQMTNTQNAGQQPVIQGQQQQNVTTSTQGINATNNTTPSKVQAKLEEVKAQTQVQTQSTQLQQKPLINPNQSQQLTTTQATGAQIKSQSNITTQSSIKQSQPASQAPQQQQYQQPTQQINTYINSTTQPTSTVLNQTPIQQQLSYSGNTIDYGRIYRPLVDRNMSTPVAGGSSPSKKTTDKSQITCLICEKLPLIGVSAVECTSCHQLFCEDCLKDWYLKNTSCKACKAQATQVPQYTNILRPTTLNALQDLQVFCIRECQEPQRLDKSLLDHEKVCGQTFQCLNCNESFPLAEKDKHVYDHIENGTILRQFLCGKLGQSQEQQQQQQQLQQQQQQLKQFTPQKSRNNIQQSDLDQEEKVDLDFQSEKLSEDQDLEVNQEHLNIGVNNFAHVNELQSSQVDVTVMQSIFQTHLKLREDLEKRQKEVQTLNKASQAKIDANNWWSNFYKTMITLILIFMLYQGISSYRDHLRDYHKVSSSFE